MPSAILHCNYCGKKFRTVKEHILNSGGTFECYNCHKETPIVFYDCCPTCHQNLGFYDNGRLEYGTSEFLKDLGSNIIKGFTSPIDAVKDGFNTIKAKYSNGAGICPVLKKRYIRCSRCNELSEISLTVKSTEIVKCGHCGEDLLPSHIREGKGTNHSKEFYRH